MSEQAKEEDCLIAMPRILVLETHVWPTISFMKNVIVAIAESIGGKDRRTSGVPRHRPIQSLHMWQLIPR